MPSPKNRIKQTGDTHMPDVDDAAMDDDLAVDLDGSGTQPEVAAFNPAASGMSDRISDRASQVTSSYRGYMAEAKEQIVAKPLAALGGAFLLGFVLARLRG